ncbi:MAG: sigma-70 family RNA polymerase sigma factor, partial [Phycisphaerae bacterium]|nr:sigma-70 family RNA polymerase sigma factor [Phycisphaerae bacterium]
APGSMMSAQVDLSRAAQLTGKEPQRVALDQDKSISDTELLRRHLAGDQEAFAALVRRYEKEVYNFLARFTGDRALADDLFQETFLQLHVSAGAFDQTRRLKPWLFTIAANKARDALRRRSRHQAAPLDATVPGTADDRTSYADLMPSNIPAPEESVLNLEDRRAVESVVNEMPEHLRTVLVLSYFSDLPYKEIAEVLDVPLGTVKSRLHAAVRHFAARWKAIAREK